MHYEIEASIYSTKPLSTVQRSSPFFTDCPTIGHHTIRSREPLKFSVKEMKQHEKDLKRLYEAHAIEIYEVFEATDKTPVKRLNMREMEKMAKMPKKVEAAPVKVEINGVPVPVISAKVTESDPVTAVVPVEAAAEPVTEVVQPETTPATVEPAAPADRKGKKGRRE